MKKLLLGLLMLFFCCSMVLAYDDYSLLVGSIEVRSSVVNDLVYNNTNSQICVLVNGSTINRYRLGSGLIGSIDLPRSESDGIKERIAIDKYGKNFFIGVHHNSFDKHGRMRSWYTIKKYSRSGMLVATIGSAPTSEADISDNVIHESFYGMAIDGSYLYLIDAYPIPGNWIYKIKRFNTVTGALMRASTIDRVGGGGKIAVFGSNIYACGDDGINAIKVYSKRDGREIASLGDWASVGYTLAVDSSGAIYTLKEVSELHKLNSSGSRIGGFTLPGLMPQRNILDVSANGEYVFTVEGEVSHCRLIQVFQRRVIP